MEKSRHEEGHVPWGAFLRRSPPATTSPALSSPEGLAYEGLVSLILSDTFRARRPAL